MPPHIVRYPPIQCNTRERCDQLQIPAAPSAWRVPEGPDNLPAAPMGGGRAWPGFDGKLHHTQRRKRRRCGGRRRVRRARLWCPWAGGGAWPGFEATRRAKLAARTARGRAATHGHTEQPGPHKQTTRHPEIRRGDKHRHQHPTTEAATGFPATASARSISATQRRSAKRHRRASATDQAVMST